MSRHEMNFTKAELYKLLEKAAGCKMRNPTDVEVYIYNPSNDSTATAACVQWAERPLADSISDTLDMIDDQLMGIQHTHKEIYDAVLLVRKASEIVRKASAENASD